MHSESTLIPLSALQHHAFCPRQCALIHVEQQWAENRLTAEGRLLHDRVHEQQSEVRNGVVICRGLHIRSLELGLSGQADVVELHPAAAGAGVAVPGRRGRWLLVPVEYKRGRPKKNSCDQVQLCAQAMCLEEMLGATVPRGYLFYGKNRRRHEVVFSDALRGETLDAAEAVRRVVSAGVVPAPVDDSRCRQCSLREVCMPSMRRGGGYVARQVRARLADWEGER